MTPLKALATDYSPRISHKAAVKKLSSWIRRCMPLFDALCRTGYCPRARTLTPAQVRLIYHYLGEP